MNLARPTKRAAICAAALTFAAVIEGIIAEAPLLTTVATCVATASLAWVTRAPVTVAALVLAIYAVAPASGTTVLSVVPFFVSLGFVGRFSTLRRGIGVGIAAALVLGLTDIEGTDSIGQLLANITYYLLMSTVLIGAGQALQYSERRERELALHVRDLDERSEERKQEAIAAERQRIARELHDVIAHALSVVGVHAAVARTTMRADGDRALVAIDRIERAAGQASDEMRRLLGLLHEPTDDAPLPQLGRIGDLIEDASMAGLQVTLRIESLPDTLSPGLDLTAFRIVQEALTNARRYAPGSIVDVHVGVEGDVLLVDVRNEHAAPDQHPQPSGGGHGIHGMRERASIYGGTLECGPDANGGFRVRAVIPVESPVQACRLQQKPCDLDYM